LPDPALVVRGIERHHPSRSLPKTAESGQDVPDGMGLASHVLWPSVTAKNLWEPIAPDRRAAAGLWFFGRFPD